MGMGSETRDESDTGQNETGNVATFPGADVVSAQPPAGGDDSNDDVGTAGDDGPDDDARTLTNLCNRVVLITDARRAATLRLSPLQRMALRNGEYTRWRTVLKAAERDPAALVRLERPPARDWTVGSILAAGLWPVVIWLVFGFSANHSLDYWAGGGAVIVLAGLVLAVVALRGSSVAGRILSTASVGVVAVTVALVMPAAAIYFGTGAREYLWAAYGNGSMSRSAVNLTLVARMIELVFIVFASLLPVALYFVFDRQQLNTLRRQFERSMFRLDRSITRLPDLETKYGEAMTEAFGREDERGRVPPGHPFPLIFATVVITLGWTVTLFATTQNRGLVKDASGVVSLLTPERSAIVFGFLGAYFFALQVVQRGYARGDLRPKSYSAITARMLTVVISAWVLEIIFAKGSTPLLLFAFIAGVVPETLFVWIREVWNDRRLLRSPLGSRWGRGRTSDDDAAVDDLMAGLTDSEPLTRLQGIDLYDRGRLTDEGITTIEGLAHADIVELLLYTRISAPRLLDWIDQAILYIHLDQTDRSRKLEALRSVGVRTATDLLAVEEPGAGRLAALLYPAAPATEQPDLYAVLRRAIDGEEWIQNLQWWSESQTGKLRASSRRPLAYP